MCILRKQNGKFNLIPTVIKYSLVPRLLPSFLSHTVQKTGREPGRFDHVCDDVLCVVLCVVLVIELLPTHAVFAHCQSRLVDCHSA